jgi:hypothetical protein
MEVAKHAKKMSPPPLPALIAFAIFAASVKIDQAATRDYSTG